MKRPALNLTRDRGFTLIELLIGMVIMLIVVIGALSLYSRSNKISADQQQYIEMQNDIRAAVYLLAKDARMAGAGLYDTFAGYALEGVDNESTGTAETPDRLKILGNIESPLKLKILNYQGSAATVSTEDYGFERQAYPDDYFIGKVVLLLPNPSSPCRGAAFRMITHVRHSSGGTNEGFNFSPGQSQGINPPGGLSDVCADSDYFDGGSLLLADMREYWLDVTGAKSGLTAGVNGYIGGGIGGVLYMTLNGVHYPLAQNVETIQFQYNGDFDADSEGRMDGFLNWNAAWTRDQVGRIRQIRIQILGRTQDAFASVGKNPPTLLHLYRRPAVANTAASSTDDWRKRFLLESTSNIRNLSLNLFNTGTR